jgi:hypothetical protein
VNLFQGKSAVFADDLPLLPSSGLARSGNSYGNSLPISTESESAFGLALPTPALAESLSSHSLRTESSNLRITRGTARHPPVGLDSLGLISQPAPCWLHRLLGASPANMECRDRARYFAVPLRGETPGKGRGSSLLGICSLSSLFRPAKHAMTHHKKLYHGELPPLRKSFRQIARAGSGALIYRWQPLSLFRTPTDSAPRGRHATLYTSTKVCRSS